MKNIVIIGGGTGTFTVLSALKKYKNLHLSAVVSMADDGGSTGRLRDEQGVLPPGDIRQCLVALSESDLLMRELFNYRFKGGSLDGHNFGNLFISALEKITGSFDKAIEALNKALKIKGKVIPVTLEKIKLFAEMENGDIIAGEGEIDTSKLLIVKKAKRFFLSPKPKINFKAKKAIREADFIIIGPGDLYTSLIPNFLVEGIVEAIRRSKAKKIYLCNLMTKFGHTDNFCVSDFVNVVEKYLGKDCLNYVIYNNKKPDEKLIEKYKRKKEFFVCFDKKVLNQKKYKSIGRNLLSSIDYKQNSADKIKRTLVRHNLCKLGRILFSIIK
ncbi:MAG: uridine diphosphate-N-acetylglucosamine-binding protein YvcK [Xanthomonadaceae bacterium]|nr:uridine diphosphate-N-acetylglucosamine-binding protein YvcK [Rhodospirillaceae bacterium]NIA17882.1 uridine diphosphate-N-acetylglucosamine-binding protein YvcK [Xanthomonadaceae bacterium]